MIPFEQCPAPSHRLGSVVRVAPVLRIVRKEVGAAEERSSSRGRCGSWCFQGLWSGTKHTLCYGHSGLSGKSGLGPSGRRNSSVPNGSPHAGCYHIGPSRKTSQNPLRLLNGFLRRWPLRNYGWRFTSHGHRDSKKGENQHRLTHCQCHITGPRHLWVKPTRTHKRPCHIGQPGGCNSFRATGCGGGFHGLYLWR